jgi:tetratricopeptide (TPR) repeat protein
MKTRTLLLTLFLAGLGIYVHTAARAQQNTAAADARQTPENGQIAKDYDKAFECYLRGAYQEAVDIWSRILRLDPGQVTAKNMIVEARQKLAASASGQKGKFYALVTRGKYSEALAKIEGMTAIDPSNPALFMLTGRIKKVAAIADRKLANSKPWNLASLGVNNYVSEEENLPFAYDTFRYAAELNPSEPRFARLVAMLEEESPQLKLNDTKPPQIGVLEHKKDLGLRYIYDSKFYLAVKELESALKLEPEDPVTLKRLGSTYLQLKDYPRAREAWNKAARLTPQDGQLQGYLQALNAMPEAAAPPKKKRKARAKKARTGGNG